MMMLFLLHLQSTRLFPVKISPFLSLFFLLIFFNTSSVHSIHLLYIQLSLLLNCVNLCTRIISTHIVFTFYCSSIWWSVTNFCCSHTKAYPYAGQFAQNLSVQQTIGGTPPNLLSTCNATAQSAHLHHSGQSSTGSVNSNQHSPTLSASIYNLSSTPSSSTTPNSIIGSTVINKCAGGMKRS